MDVVVIPIINVLSYAIRLYMWAIIIYVVMTWLVQFNIINTTNRFVSMVGEFLHRAVDPALRPLRRLLPNLGGIDISPIMLILGLMLLQDILLRIGQRIAFG